MCLIIKKPAGRRLCPAFIRNAWQRNGDGWGLVRWNAAGELVSQRGMRLDELLALCAMLPDDAPAYLHLRQATVGAVNLAMAHPFEVRPGILLMHNGSLKAIRPSLPGHSDTAELARRLAGWLDGLDDAQARARLRHPSFQRRLSGLVRGSMVVLLDRDGAVTLGRDWHPVAADEWHADMHGIEVSNARTWRPQCPQAFPHPWADLRWQVRLWRARLAA